MIIYKTTNLINGKFYIGFDSKNRDILKYPGSGLKLNLAIEKYGIDNFEKVILEYVNEDNWGDREKYWIDVTDARNIGYNIAKGGSGGSTREGYANSDNMRMNISNSKKGHPLSESHKESLTGRKFTEEHKKNISESKKGKILTESHKIKVSQSLKGRVFTEEHKENLSLAGKGRVFTEEHKEKIKKREFSEEWKLKLSNSSKGKNLGFIWINDGFHRKRINIEQLQIFIDSGWKRGKLF
jgi:group I intron endonuclease